MFPGYEYVSALRLTKIVQGLTDVREQPQELLFLNRAAKTPAFDGEVMGRFVGRALIADLVADDAVAGVYSSGKLTFESYQSPNLKIGRQFSQSQLKQLQSIGMQLRGTQGESMLMDFIGPIAENALLGVKWRQEALLVGLHADSLSYDRLGIKASGSWGMPSDLKITPSIAWTDAANATPINDILAAKLTASVRYGMDFTRLTMSTQAFRYLIATAEYQNKAKLYLAANISFTNISLNDLATNRKLFESVTGCTVVLYDARYWSMDNAGNLMSTPFLPINKVILDSPSNDRNASVYDLSDGIVTESLFFGMNPAGVVGANTMASLNGQRGPVSYMTFPPELNPANLTLWAASVNWPRRNLLQMNAVLTIGTFVDAIPVGEPF